MTMARDSQEALERLALPASPNARVSQSALEVLRLSTNVAYVSQEALEVLRQNPAETPPAVAPPVLLVIAS
jgi:hypothetical protein